MNISKQTLLIVLSFSLAFTMPCPLLADGGGSAEFRGEDPAMSKANTAIKEKDWDKAIEILNRAIVHDMKNADAYNLLGYSERMRGNLDAAFKNYDHALAIDPRHLGAHEYIGEAYLMAGNLPKAEEHLAKLDKLCFFSCEEYSDLKAAITAYKQKNP